MNKNLILTIAAVVIIAAGIFVLAYTANQKNNIPLPEGIILFYGEGCPHCKSVDDFMAQNQIEDNVKFTRLEVWYNKNNQNLLAEAAKICNITSNQVGVPFLYDGSGKCYMGDVDAIDFFKKQAGIE